jgi:broad specificity phosphatase PhoE
MERRVVAASVAVLFGTAGFAPAQQAVILVRHAEKASGGGQDPGLSDAGEARANALATSLRDAGVDAIYTTEYLRTRKTAEPLARAIGKRTAVIEDDTIAALAERHKDQVVVIVAHSGVVKSVPTYVDQITGRKNGIVLGENDFDQMFILVPKRDGKWSVTRARYGAASRAPAGKR